jgi:aspartyl-tRNA(Asn)/glutamyl-tRNA(Gln) amidotransferase subunit C
MMKIDNKLLKHVAQLARLEFSAKEEQEYLKNFTNILNYFEILKNAPTDGIAPLFNTAEQGLMKNTKVVPTATFHEGNHMHADMEQKTLSVQAALSNAPDQAENQIKINAVIEEL